MVQVIPVLILGETGTGKELVARLVHKQSARENGPWVAVNCASMPESLAESELFGHVRGAFTGADRDRLGKFELAHKGTLFLDEIGDLHLNLQAKLLRVLQEGELQRLGSDSLRQIDVRIVAATHRDLEAMVTKEPSVETYYIACMCSPCILHPSGSATKIYPCWWQPALKRQVESLAMV